MKYKEFKMQQQFTQDIKMEMETVERIRSRVQQHGHPDEIDQLCLDSIKIKSFSLAVSAEISKCTNLQYLTLNYCEIQSLENFPFMQSLVALELISNHITGVDIKAISNCQNLEMLALDQNNIQKIEDLEPLNTLLKLQHLEVRGNPICTNEQYRQKIFALLPRLKIVDCQDQFGDEEVMYGTETESQRTESEDDEEQENSSDQDEQDQLSNQNGRKYRHF